MQLFNKKGIKLRNVYSADNEVLSGAYRVDGTSIPFVEFFPSAILQVISSFSSTKNKQGACTDGTYIYQYCDANAIIKYKISDGTYNIVELGSSITYGHGNDMTYNPYNNHIYIATMERDGSVIELDTDLNYITTRYIVGKNGNPYPVWGICFDKNEKKYYSEVDSNRIAFYDEDFNYLGWVLSPHPNSTAQGFETDGLFLYRLTYNPNTVYVTDMMGNEVCTIEVPMTGEPEGIMYDWLSGKFYVSRNSTTGIFYEMWIKDN